MDTRVIVEKRHPAARIPAKAHATDACFDVSIPEATTLPPRSTCIVDSGLGLQLEEGWEAQIRGRSGLATRGLVVHPGTIDHLYRQNLRIIVHNIGDTELPLEAGMRLAQMKIERVWRVELTEGPVEQTARGGLGSTGL